MFSDVAQIVMNVGVYISHAMGKGFFRAVEACLDFAFVQFDQGLSSSA